MTGLEATSLAMLIVFSGLLNATVVMLAYRIVRYRQSGLPTPALLWRDLLVNGGFGLTLGVILLVRVLRFMGIAIETHDELWYTLLTSVPALLGMVVFVYFEVWVIESPPPSKAYEERA